MILLSSPRRQAGYTLLVTVMTMAIVGVFIDLSLQYTNNVSQNVQRSLLLRQATNIGDASTEMSFSAWRAICRASPNAVLKGSAFDNELPTPTPGNFPGVADYTLSNYTVNPLDSKWIVKTGNNATPAPIAGPNHGDVSYYYLATADVVIPTVRSDAAHKTDLNDPANIVARVRRVFEKEVISLWRYAIFYNDDMEIHPGATMAINGPVHTNGSLYTGHKLLALNGKTTYTDKWSIGFMSEENSHDNETPTSPTFPINLPPAADQTLQPYGVQLDDYHGLIEQITDPSDPLYNDALSNQAGVTVTIQDNPDPSKPDIVRVFNAAGVDISNSGSGDDKTLGSTFRDAITTNQTITDNREGATTGNGSIRLTTLDVSKITSSVDNGTMQNFNGIVYMVDLSADPAGITKKRAIRLKNGAKLPDGGLTVVSGNPIYVQGDYNTGSSLAFIPGIPPSIQPPSNTGTATSPTVTGYTRQPAAVVGDAVTFLSNSWVDSKSGNKQPASSTTYNTAIISGNVPSANGNYSGGVENFPRFLEGWSGKTVTYYGSMIELYKSEQAIGRWGSANVYDAPKRAWYFDDKFTTHPPPGLLYTVNYRRSRWYTL